MGNIFLDEKMKVKIGDFGLATEITFDGERKRTLCGTPNYIAPEILTKQGHSHEVDIWSTGEFIKIYKTFIKYILQAVSCTRSWGASPHSKPNC